MRKLWLIVPVAVLGILYYTSAQTVPVGPPPTPPTPALGDIGKTDRAKTPGMPKLSEDSEPIRFSAQLGSNWLKRAVTAEGRFVYGFQPALRVELDGDNFVSQAGAAFALARSARVFRDQEGTARARQVLLTLLNLETIIDPDDATKSARFCAAPPQAVNRLSSNGLLISAVHELDGHDKSPKDLLRMADELCNHVRQLQRPDGSLAITANGAVLKSGSDEFDAYHAGLGLQGIIRSQRLGPAEWKLEMLRKARTHYLAQWSARKNVGAACSHAPAYAEAFIRTNDPAFKEAVFAMTDWLIGLQYREDLDAVRGQWAGGFPRYRDGRVEAVAPDIQSALPTEALAEACRVAKHAGDLAKLRDYERAMVLNARFLMKLQYTAEKTNHFIDRFRPYVLGGFYVSPQDGNLRIDATQYALAGMAIYLDAVAE